MNDGKSDSIIGATDITAGTEAELAFRLYSESVKKIHELEYTRDMYAKEYLREMKCAKIPYFLSLRYNQMQDLCIPDNETDKDRIERHDFVSKMFSESVFSPEFLENHKIRFLPTEYYGCDMAYAIVVMCIGGTVYEMYCPQPGNIDSIQSISQCGSEGVKDLRPLMYSVVKISLEEFENKNSIRCFTSVGRFTYDWKECALAIENDVKSNE